MRRLTLIEAEFIAHRLARKLMDYPHDALKWERIWQLMSHCKGDWETRVCKVASSLEPRAQKSVLPPS